MSEKRHRGRRLEVRMRTRATPEAVWDAWADPEKIAHWFVDRARGRADVGATFTWIFEKFGYEIPYEVVASEPGKRFALGGEAPKSGPFLLEVNSGFLDGREWDEEFEEIVSGWTNALAILKHYLENYAGRPKQTLLVVQSAVYGYARLLPFYATAEGLDGWLTTAASIGGLGESCALRLPDGRSLTGRVLSKTGWEVAVSCEEVDGVLELKGFRFPGAGKVVGARMLSWGRPLSPDWEESLQAALQRLAAALDNRHGASR